jgi:cysteine desulfurase family protein (TIGR01976 family)
VKTGLDLNAVRRCFPALARSQHGQPVVFADAPGGTQVPQSVIEAVAGYLRASNANTGGAFDTSRETDELILRARAAGAALLGCAPDEVVFGPNMTTLAFALSRSLARLIEPGDEIVLTVLDHDANIAPWLHVAEERGATVRWVDVRTEDGTLDLDTLDAALSSKARIVAFTLASNALGTVTPAAEIVRRAKERGAIVVGDAVHFAQHRPIDVRTLGVDVLFCSAYKFFGPHLGLMYGRRELLEEWRPYRVRPADDAAPARWETGTLNHEGLAGLVAAIDYLGGIGRSWIPEADASGRAAVVAGLQTVAEYEAGLSSRFLEGLDSLPGVRLFGIGDPRRVSERTPTFALRIGDVHPREAAEALGRRGIFCWEGNYFALAIMERLGLEATGGAVRIGFCHYNTPDEVDRVLMELGRLA